MAPRWGTSPWRVEWAATPRALPARAQAVVVGGGLTGLGAALALARRGIDAVLLEAATIGAGASGRTGAIVLEHTAAGPREGVDDCVPFLARLVADEAIACDLDLRGCWEIRHRPAADAADARDQLPLRWRDADQELVVADTVTGGTVDVGALLAGLARAATGAGAVIHEHAEVVELTTGEPTRLRVRTSAGEHAIAAEHVVVALNAYTRALVPLATDLVPALTMAVATAPLGDATLAAIGLADRLPFYTRDLPYLWGRVLAGGRVVFGSGLAFDPEHRVERLEVASGEAAAALTRLEARVRGFHPALASIVIERRWGGPIAFRNGWNPLLARHPESSHVIVAGGYSGHGVALSVRVGDLVAAAIARERPLPAWGAFAS